MCLDVCVCVFIYTLLSLFFIGLSKPLRCEQPIRRLIPRSVPNYSTNSKELPVVLWLRVGPHKIFPFKTYIANVLFFFITIFEQKIFPLFFYRFISQHSGIEMWMLLLGLDPFCLGDICMVSSHSFFVIISICCKENFPWWRVVGIKGYA